MGMPLLQEPLEGSVRKYLNILHHREGPFSWVIFYLDSKTEPRKGINLFMIDLNEKALALASQEFEEKYKNIKIVTKQFDLTSLSDQNIYNKLDQELS